MVVEHKSKRDAIVARVFKSTLSNYIGKFISLGAGFLLTPFILYMLGPSVYGLGILVGSITAYGSLLDFGIASAITKYVAEYRARQHLEQANALVATALSLYSIIAIVIAVASAIVAPVFADLFRVPLEQHQLATWLVFLSGLSVALSIPCTAATAVLRGLQRFDLASLVSVISTLLSVAGTIIVLLLGGGIIGLTLVGIAVLLSTQALSIRFIHRVAPELRYGWRGANRTLLRTVASFSWSLFLLRVGGQLETRTDEIVIGAFLPLTAVTPYNIARRLSEIPQMLTEQFVAVLLPIASQLHAENDAARLRSLYITSTRLTLVLFLPIACSLVILAGPLLTVWVGAAYSQYTDLVLILTLASLIDTSQWPAGFVLQGMERHRLSSVVATISGLSNLVLSLLLVRTAGLAGVAMGTLIPTTLVCLGFILPYTLHTVKVKSREAIANIFLPALVPSMPMAIVLYALRESIKPSSPLILAVVAGIGLLVYAFVYLLLGADGVERQALRGLAASTLRLAGLRFNRL